MINPHPALPGLLVGNDSLRETYEAARRGGPGATGCRVHYVVPEVNAGEVINTEYRLIVHAVGQWSAGR